MSLSIRKLTSRIGALIEGADLTAAPSDEAITSLRGALNEHKVIVFDNRITQHYAIDNYDDFLRRLNRVTVAGDVPASVDSRRSRQLVGDVSHYSRILETAA
jgi:alpha-ketoglutarate-dependent taurine dioxygenase